MTEQETEDVVDRRILEHMEDIKRQVFERKVGRPVRLGYRLVCPCGNISCINNILNLLEVPKQ
jgi:hypothetical protein